MAVLLTKTMGQLNEERKPMFPLFEKPSKAIKSENKVAPTLRQTTDASPATDNVPKEAARGSKKPKKVAKDDLNPLPPPNFSIVIPPADKSELLEVDPNDGRRKRQKTASTKDKASESTEDVPLVTSGIPRQRKAPSSNKIRVTSGVETSANETTEPALKEQVVERSNIQDQLRARIQTTVNIGSSRPSDPVQPDKNGVEKDSSAPSENKSTTVTQPTFINDASERTEGATNPLSDSKPKKILHFNPKSGTIGSPPAKKVVPTDHTKPRSNGRTKQPKSKLVTIRYGHGEVSTSAIGLQIDQILKGTKSISPIAKKKQPSAPKPTEVLNVDAQKSVKPTNTVPMKPPAALHPFFSGKPVVKPPKTQETAKVDPVVIDLERQEPSRLRRATAGSRDKPPSPSKPRSSAFTGFPGFGTSTKLLKFPGAIEPAWPWKEMVHIRGNEDVKEDEQQPTKDATQLRSKPKKSKYQAIQILAEEDLITTFANDLCINQVLSNIKEINLDQYPQLPPCLRIPIKHFESGYDLQRRVKKELQARPRLSYATNDDESSEEDLQDHGPSRSSIHPALLKAYTSIATSLTAFDQFRYETQPWTQKYSPKSTAEVLQTGREAMILKEWLQKLTVMSVETRSSDPPNSRASSVSRLSATSKSDPSGKRKRKAKKLDGFVISSDEEDNDMDEISEPEDETSPRGSQGLLKKTIVRASKDAPRLGNAVVISGPHGCGKTAAVYAVAKELGFEVFEINPSSRRSGKDILEKVGDMTRNHLVQRSHHQTPGEVLDEDARRVSDALADDIKSGRQGTMNSFFQPKDATKAKPKPKKSNPAAKTAEPVQASLAPKAPPKRQKQSLILFEEVDVLYEEDKQFWATVMTLVLQSKRPVIMTCKDESVVPTQALSLHAILRFSPPPIDLATDYMLSVAANEGHALERNAVESLYQSRYLDLRASLTELNFWCQFAIGDVKGGLDWICPRWPLGCDVDKHGNTIRVVSEKTYEAGMGWLSQDFLESHAHYLDIEEETLHQAWEGWHLDLGDWQKSIDMTGWAKKKTMLSTGRADQHACLNIYDDFADAMSIADLCSGSSFASDNHVLLDVAIPKLSSKVREDYLLDHPLLEAVPLMDYAHTGPDIALWMKSHARKYLQVDQHVKYGFEVPSELDRPSEAHIISLIRDQISSPEFLLTRQDLSTAFDPISEPEKSYVWSTVQLEASVFDRSKTIITTDLAPYVRSIVSYDAKLQEERSRMSNLLSEGGRKGKRMRTTRSAMSALEGGARSTTRKDKYFGPMLNPYLALKTGMPNWLEAVSAGFSGTPNVGSRLSTGNSDISKAESEGQDDLAEDSS